MGVAGGLWIIWLNVLPLPSTIYRSCLRGLWEPFIYKTLIICFLFNKGIINHLIAMLIIPLDLCNMFDVAWKEGYISYDPSHPWSIKVNLFSCGWSHKFSAIRECWYLHSAFIYHRFGQDLMNRWWGCWCFHSKVFGSWNTPGWCVVMSLWKSLVLVSVLPPFHPHIYLWSLEWSMTDELFLVFLGLWIWQAAVFFLVI